MPILTMNGKPLGNSDGILYMSDDITPVLPTNTCGACDPPLYDEYTVTISGASTFPVDPNGTWTVSWSVDCIWQSALNGVGVGVVLFWNGSSWFVQDQEFAFTWLGGTDQCTITGVYSPTGSGTCVVS